MKVYKIVLTGGPNGGKTKIIERLSSYLKELNYNVILIPETARDVIAAGIKPNPSDRNYTLWFQDLMMKYQNIKEHSAEVYAEISNEDTVILYDRAIPDNFAYLDSFEDYNNLLTKNNLKELSLIDNYDLIINLSSLANFEKYDYQNDNERTEDRELSKKLDFKTSTSYLLSRNLKIIYPTDNIDEKYEIIEGYVNDLLNCKETKEVIRYDVDINSSILTNYNKDNSKTLFNTNLYLANELNDVEYVLSRRICNNEANYLLTKSREKDNVITLYDSKVITDDEYNYLLRKYKIIDKSYVREITFIYDFKRYKLIIDNNNNCTLEIEKSNFLTDIKIPDNIKLKNNLVKSKKYGNI